MNILKIVLRSILGLLGACVCTVVHDVSTPSAYALSGREPHAEASPPAARAAEADSSERNAKLDRRPGSFPDLRFVAYRKNNDVEFGLG